MDNNNEDFNIILSADSYKMSQWKMYPEKMEYMYSYLEPRIGAKHSKIPFFGLQYILKKYFVGEVVTQEKIDEAEFIINSNFRNTTTFNKEGWKYILKTYNGRLPVKICALPEGTCVSPGNVMLSIENTDPKCAWLTNYLETILMNVWYPCTVAATALEMKNVMDVFYHTSCDAEDFTMIKFMVHNFGLRACTDPLAGEIASAAHLLSFNGSDSVCGLKFIKEFYEPQINMGDFVCWAPAATEHSVMTVLGREGEEKVFKHLLNVYKDAPLACVIDSYDSHGFIKNIVSKYKDEILKRKYPLVLRPDSGDPSTESLCIIELLDEIFGHTVNKKDFKVLNPAVRVIWGDGIDCNGMQSVLFSLNNHGWAASNICFGCGGKLNQVLNRDTERFACKASAVCIDGVWHDVYKDPITYSGDKRFDKHSKPGFQYFDKNTRSTVSVSVEGVDSETKLETPESNMLRPVFECGQLLVDEGWDDIIYRIRVEENKNAVE